MSRRPASRILLALLAATALLVAGAVGLAAAEDADLAARIDAYVAPFVTAGHLSGTLLVARSGDVMYERSWGLADAEHAVPVRADTRIGIASVTKPMTIVLVCRLVEEGKLSPDDTIAKWIADFPRGEEKTVSHLLNHRACVPHRVTTPEQETAPHTAADMVELVKGAEQLPYEPGEKSVYSSAGFSVLARIVELASGMSYDEALQHYLCEPAGMEHTGHHDSREIVPDRAKGYFLDADGWVNGPLQDLSFLVGAGSVVSTPRDLHRMVRAIVDGRLGAVVPGALMREHGMGWNGVTHGFRAFVQYDSDADTEIIFTGNLLTGAADALQRDLPQLLAGGAVSPPDIPEPALVEWDPAAIRRVEGRYRDDRDHFHDLLHAGGRWSFGQWLLLPVEPSTFTSMQDYARVEVVAGDDGSVERLDWIRPDGTSAWRRVPAADLTSGR